MLVIANETARRTTLLDAAAQRAAGTATSSVTVIAPVSEPRQGYVVYKDTRRASAAGGSRRRSKLLREAGVPAQGFVVETEPVQAGRTRSTQLEPTLDEIIVSTHAQERPGWMRRDVVGDIERVAGGCPFGTSSSSRGRAARRTCSSIANQTVSRRELLDRIRERAAQGPASFLIVAPQGDDEEHAEADRRLRRALAELRGEGIDAHGQVVHPDPYTAAMEAIDDERVDEIIVSTFPSARCGWLRRDLFERLRKRDRPARRPRRSTSASR